MRKLAVMFCVMLCLFASGCGSGNEKVKKTVKNVTKEETKELTSLLASSRKESLDRIKEEVIEEKTSYAHCEIKYPHLEEDEYQNVNKKILAEVKKLSGYDDIFESESDEVFGVTTIRLHYSTGTFNDRILSVLFEGEFRNNEAAHPVNLAFGLNLDLKTGEFLHIGEFSDVIRKKQNMERYIKEQVDGEEAEYREGLLSAWKEKGEEQFLESKRFYLSEGKVYFVLSIPAGSEAYQIICLE